MLLENHFRPSKFGLIKALPFLVESGFADTSKHFLFQALSFEILQTSGPDSKDNKEDIVLATINVKVYKHVQSYKNTRLKIFLDDIFKVTAFSKFFRESRSSKACTVVVAGDFWLVV